MDQYTLQGWPELLSRSTKLPAPWFSKLLKELDPYLSAPLSEQERKSIADWLLASPLFGKCDHAGFLSDSGLVDWEKGIWDALQSSNDRWSSIPGKELPRLVREFAQPLKLLGLDPVGAIPNADMGRIGWQKHLTAQGCAVYRWERENKVVLPMDWVPRVKQAGSNSWPEADSVQLPIFFVGRGSDGAVQGLNGWLRLWLWPCEGAQLELLPSVPQRVQPLAHSWDTGLQNACQWMRNQMSPQGGAWKNHALVWDVHTVDFAYDLLLGDSASAAFALAGLWLARQWAPPCWSGLHSVRREDWMKAHITAAIRPGAEAANKAASVADLGPVGGVDVKAPASWVLGQGSAQRQPPLRVALNQIVAEPAVPGQPKPLEYASAHDLLQDLAREALNLSEAQSRLLGWLQPHLPAFGPDEHTSSSSPWHLPRLEQPPLAIEDADGWANNLCDIAQDAQPPEHLVPFALTRWALRAHEQHEGGQVHSMFVNLFVSEDQWPQHSSPRADRVGNSGVPGSSPETFTLEQLLADYERDSRQPTRQFQALQIVGAPGAGKTWLLARFEQACAERLLWQQDRRASQPPPTDADAVGQDPYPFDDVPLYVAMSTLPAAAEGDEAITGWFLAQVLGAPVANAPDSRLRQRLLYPANESGPRLRLMLDGLNELKVAPGKQRQDRARQVVHALWRTLKPGLMMLLGTRTHHRFELDATLDSTGERFRVATAELQRWSVPQMVGYLRQRWAHGPHQALLEEVADIEARLRQPRQQRLREVLSLPLYWRIQCELLEAGAKQLLDSRARLMAALLWRQLHHEFAVHAEKGENRSDPALITAQERAIAADFRRSPDTVPPAFPRKGRLLQGLFALAWAMWLANPDEPVESRGRVALPLDEEDAKPDEPAQPALSVRGCLRGLGWRAQPPDEHAKWIEQWIEAAKDLGWLTVDRKSNTARFTHQAYGEFLASQQLFWRERHAQWVHHPQPKDWTADERAELSRQLAPPALERGCLEELDFQHVDLARLWGCVPKTLLDEWLEKGLTLPSQTVEEAVKRYGWNGGEIRREIDVLKVEDKPVITEQGENWVWSLQRYGDWLHKHDVFTRCDKALPWQSQRLAWALMARHTGLWRPYRQQMRQELEQRLGDDRTRELYSDVGRLPDASAGTLDEIALLALEALQDPLPWLQEMLRTARLMTSDHGASQAANQTGCWALLARALLQEASRLDQLHGASQELARLRREFAGLLLAVNQSADPELSLQQAGQRDSGTVGAHDLRHRLQAGLCLGRQGPLGSDAGDHLRYESVVVKLKDCQSTQGVRLRREHWCNIRPEDEYTAPFLMARYLVTVGEFMAFVDAGGYRDTDADWWLQGQTPEGSGARKWLLDALVRGLRSRKTGLDYWGDERWMTNLRPMVGVTWYEAAAYAYWASSVLYADWLAAMAQQLRVGPLTLRLPTEHEWRAALCGVGNDGWPGHRGSGDTSPLLFNHLATGWGRTSPVGSFPASRAPSGILDSLGNAWEWCANDPYGKRHEYCVADLKNGKECRALRGGSYYNTASTCRVGYRFGSAPDRIDDNNGFRLVLAVAL